MATSVEKTGLRQRSIGFWESLALSVEAMGPLLGALSVAPLIAISAGFLSTWLSFMYYVLFVPQLMLAFGIYANSGFSYVFGVDIPWWAFALFAGGVALTLSLIGIRISTRIDLGLAIIADVVLLLASIVLLVKSPHVSLAPLSPTHAGGGFTGLSLAVATGVLVYLGFEQSFTLGEEVKDPHGNVPKAIYTALVSIGLLLLFATFSMVSAFGVHGMGALASANSADGTPWWAAFSRVGVGSGWRDALSIVIMTSVLGNLIASHNCVVRIQYGMGRARALPSAFGRTGRRQTPYVAISVQIAVSLAVTLIMGFAWSTPQAFGFLGFTNGLSGAVAFIILLAAAMIYFHRVEPEKGIVRNLLLPGIGIAILVPAVYTAFYPNPGEPLKWAPYVILGWTLLGGIYLIVRDRQKHVIDVDYALGDLGETSPDQIPSSHGATLVTDVLAPDTA